MAEVVERVPAETRWTIATQALTGALVATMKALLDAVGQERYNEITGQIWGGAGMAFKEVADALGLASDDAKSVAETFALVSTLAMGPEAQLGTVEATAEKAVLNGTGCALLNRQKELGISEDILDAGDSAYCEALTKALNPKVTLAHDKAMHRGDPYCEWVFELKK